MIDEKIIIAGFGGQGALRIGQIIAQAAIRKGLEAEWLPSYGAEMRGGTANCHVTISDREITFPMIKHADTCIIMNDLSLEKFEQSLVAGGKLIINSDIVTKKNTRKDIELYKIPADTMAWDEGNHKGANMALLGAYVALSGIIDIERVCNLVRESFTGAKAGFADSNVNLIKAGGDFIKNGLWEGSDGQEI